MAGSRRRWQSKGAEQDDSARDGQRRPVQHGHDSRTTEEAAARLQRPSWRDPRLLLGAAIVMLSVTGVVSLVAAQNETTPVYAAARTLSVGESVSEEDLTTVDVQLDEAGQHYMPATEELPEDWRYIAVVEEGELLPRRAVETEDPLDRQAVTVDVKHTLAKAVEPGRQVDVWSTSAALPAGADEGSVTQVVSGAEVSSIQESTSTFGATNTVTIELLVDPQELPGLLEAGGSGGSLAVVPAGSPVEGD